MADIETNWFVLSGPPEYGTRVLAGALSRELFPVISDGAAILDAYSIEGRRDAGVSNPVRAYLRLLEQQMEYENGLRVPYRSLVIFNGGIGDKS